MTEVEISELVNSLDEVEIEATIAFLTILKTEGPLEQCYDAGNTVLVAAGRKPVPYPIKKEANA